MTVRLNITMDAKLYRRLKKEIPPRGISAFIEGAVRSCLRPDRKSLEASYAAASKEAWRDGLEKDWEPTDLEGWPE
jgi:hypothetical protein